MALTVPVMIEPMTLDDVESANEIERLSFSTPWPPYAFEQELRGNRLAHYLVARSGDAVVGFAGIWVMVDDAHVTTISVHPEWRRRGVASRLLLALADLAVKIGARRLTLEVRPSNLGAQALYRRFGFTVAGRRARYYTDDGEDALVMTTAGLDDPVMVALLEAERRRLA